MILIFKDLKHDDIWENFSNFLVILEVGNLILRSNEKANGDFDV